MSVETTTDRSPFRDILSGAAIYSLAVIAQRIASILLLPLYTRYLSRHDYGVLEMLDLLLNIISLLVMGRLGQALFYFYYHAEDEHQRRQYVTSALLGACLLGMITAVVGIIFAAPIGRLLFGMPGHTALVVISVLGWSISLPVEIGYCYLRVCDRASTYVTASICRLVGIVALNVLFLVVLGLGVSSLLWSSLITGGCLAAYMTWMILRTYPPSFEAAAFFRMIRYCVPLGISAVGEVTLSLGDRAFLRRSVSLADLGLYGLAYKLGMLVMFVITPFFTYWNAKMVGIVRRPDGEYLYARVCTYILLVLTVVVLLLTLFIDPLLWVMVVPSFRGAGAFAPWVGLAYLLR